MSGHRKTIPRKDPEVIRVINRVAMKGWEGKTPAQAVKEATREIEREAKNEANQAANDKFAAKGKI